MHKKIFQKKRESEKIKKKITTSTRLSDAFPPNSMKK